MSIHVLASVEIIGQFGFSYRGSLQSIIFEANSRLSRFESSAFCETGLTSIHFPSSIEIIGKSYFSACRLLEKITFEANSP
jgi:hypothetical protein